MNELSTGGMGVDKKNTHKHFLCFFVEKRRNTYKIYKK